MRKITFKALGQDPKILQEKFNKNEITEAEFKSGLGDVFVDYKPLLITILSGTKADGPGIQVAEMRVALSAIEKIEDSKEFVLLTSEEFSYLENLMKQVTFSVAHKNLLKFIEDILTAEEVNFSVDMAKRRAERRRRKSGIIHKGVDKLEISK